MKPYSEYGHSMRGMLRYLYRRHPKPVTMQGDVEGAYEALQRDGWVEPIGKRSMKLTDKGAFKLAEITRQS